MVTIISLTSVEYQFSCTATSSSDLIVSLLIDGEWYSSNNSTSIQVTLPLSHLTVGTYYFLCVANSSIGSDSSVDTFDVIGKFKVTISAVYCVYFGPICEPYQSSLDSVVPKLVYAGFHPDKIYPAPKLLILY